MRITGPESEFMDGFHGAAKSDAQEFKRLDARIAELESLVYVPGLWRCAKCDFHLVQAVLSASTGTVHSHDKPGEKCPNCASPLWRVTERQAGNDMAERCERAVLRNRALETALGRVIDYCDAATHGDDQYRDERGELIRIYRGE